ncbi:UNVERIFIED_CONTAM: hypothetical protein Slati_3689100, partial [Sesamum latifolium]
MIMETNKFNGTDYNDWLWNLRIVLNFENHGYILDMPLPTALPEVSSPEECITFEKWFEDNRKVRSIILASMTNNIQKQYDKLEDVPQIMLCMKEVYAVPNRHIRYVATKAFFGTKIAEGSSVQSHGVKMASLVEKLEDLKAKLEDLKAGLDNDTYIDVIFQSLLPSYDPFIINYNMNGLEKSIHELINMLVQYKATTHKSAPAVLVREVSTTKVNDKRAGRWKMNKGKGKVVAATASAPSAPVAPLGMGKGKVKVGDSQRSKANDVCMHCQGKGHWKRECPQLLSNPSMFVIELNMIIILLLGYWIPAVELKCAHSVCINVSAIHHNKADRPNETTVQQLDRALDGGHEINCLRLGLECSKSRTSRMGIESPVETCTKSRIHWMSAASHRRQT